jgi:hypothetical protein
VKNSRPKCQEMAAAAAIALLAWSSLPAQGQAVAAPATGNQADPNPYYIGASEALTHDSNVFRVPAGPSDNYSSTTLLGGFDQPIGRQRLFGRANVTANRYQRETDLNNTSYNLAAGADLATIEHISGNLNGTLGRSLTAPTATVNSPTATRNLADTRSVDATVRWGGVSILTLEGTAGWSRVDYSAPESVTSDSSQERASLGLYYGPGGPLRLGVAGRFNRTKTPQAFLDPATQTFQPNTVDGKNLDLTANYQLTGIITTDARLSYTKQSSSGIAGADFSGLTGGLSVNWRATGKTSVRFDASRDAGFDSGLYNTIQIVNNAGVLVLAPVAGLYENNRITNSIGADVGYAATAKIQANANARYSRAQLVTSALVGSLGPGAPNTTDVSKTASLGATYAITRYWDFACRVAREWRDVSGGVAFAYTANLVSCSTQLTLR